MDGQMAKPLPRTESATSSESEGLEAGARSDAAMAVSSLLESLSTADAIEALAKLSRIAAEPTSAPALLTAGAVQAVALTMRAFEVSIVQYRALSALRAFSVAPGLRSEVLRAGGLELTLALMSADSSLTVQDRGATIVANLAVGCPHRKRRLAREGAIAAVVRAMNLFPSDVQMQVRGSLALRNLAHNAQVNQYIAAKAGAVDAVLDALLFLGRTSGDRELLYQTIAALESMCTQDKANRARIVDRDARAWPTRVPLEDSMPRCASAANAGDMSPVSSGSNPNRKGNPASPHDEFRPHVEPNSCPDSLSLRKQRIARSHFLDEDPIHGLNENSSPTLEPLTQGDDHVEPKSSPPASPPISIPVSAVTQAPASSNAIAEVPSGTPATTDAAGGADSPSVFRAVLKAVRRAPENRGLLKYALSLLALTAWKRTDVQELLGELGAVEVALATVKRYGRDVPLVTRACTLLCTLCLQAANRERSRPGLGVLLRALDANADSVPATREIAAAVSNALYCAPENRAAVLARSGARAVSDAIVRVAARDVRVLEAGLCTLRNLVDGAREGAERCAKEGAIGAARSALDVTKAADTDAACRVQTQAVLLLGDMAKSAPDTASEMVSMEVADWVENALAKLERKEYREAHVVGDELLAVLQDCSEFPKRAGEDASEDGDSHSFSFSKRWQHTRSLFSLSLSLRQSKRSSGSKRRRSRRSNTAGKRQDRPEIFFGRRWPLGCP